MPYLNGDPSLVGIDMEELAVLVTQEGVPDLAVVAIVSIPSLHPEDGGVRDDLLGDCGHIGAGLEPRGLVILVQDMDGELVVRVEGGASVCLCQHCQSMDSLSLPVKDPRNYDSPFLVDLEEVKVWSRDSILLCWLSVKTLL